MSKNKEFYVTIQGKKILVSEEVYRAYVRPIRAEQRQKRREWKCPVPGKKGNLVRCQEDCSKCKYALAGNNARGNVLSLDTFKEEGVEILDRDFDLEAMYIENEERTSLQKEIRKAINALPKKQRQVIILMYLKNKTQEEIADLLGVQQPAISKLQARGTQRIKELLKNSKKFF